MYFIWYKKSKRIYRHKLPNLSTPGLNFYHCQKNIPPKSFQKTVNRLKLLEQPYQPCQKQHFQTDIDFYNTSKKKDLFRRTEQLAKPKIRSKSLPPQRQQPKKIHKQRRFMFPQMDNYIQKSNKSSYIITTSLITEPTETTFNQLQNKTKQSDLQHQSDDESSIDATNNYQNVEDFKPDKSDFIKWVSKIIGGQQKLYDQYDKELMRKIKTHQRKQSSVRCQTMWR